MGLQQQISSAARKGIAKSVEGVKRSAEGIKRFARLERVLATVCLLPRRF